MAAAANSPDVGLPGPPRLRRPTPRVALVLVVAALVAVVLLAAFAAVKPFLLGALLVYVLAPVVERLARTGLPRVLAVLLTLAGTVAALAVVASLALGPFVTQVRLFVDDLPGILDDARAAVLASYEGADLPPELRDAVDAWIADAGSTLAGIDLGALVSPLVTSLVTLVGTVTAYAILPAWLFFVLKDRLRLADGLERGLPPGWRGDSFAVLAIANRVFGNWARGQLFLGVVVGVASYVGLMVLAATVDPVFARYAVLLAIIAGVLELVPFIGPIIAAVPAALIGLLAGPTGFLAAIALYLVIQQLENNLLVPKIQGDAVELHPSVVMIALVVGASLAGILGAIVSLPVTAAGRDVFRYAFRRLSDPPASVDEALAGISPRLPALVRRSAVGAAAADAERGPGSAGAAHDSDGEKGAAPGTVSALAVEAPASGARDDGEATA